MKIIMASKDLYRNSTISCYIFCLLDFFFDKLDSRLSWVLNGAGLPRIDLAGIHIEASTHNAGSLQARKTSRNMNEKEEA